MSQELLWSELHVLDDLAEQDWGNVSTPVDGHGCATTVGMAELLVGATLPHLHKPKRQQDRDHLTRFEDREPRHLCGDRLDSYKLRFELGLAILEEHGENLLEICGEFLTGLPLRMSPGKAGDIADQKTSLGVLLYYSREFSHILRTLRVRTNDTLS